MSLGHHGRKRFWALLQIHHSRAGFTDIRDGLKPVQRRILYSMNKDGNTFDKGRKSAKSVGNIMGNFHCMVTAFITLWCVCLRIGRTVKFWWKCTEITVLWTVHPPAAMRYTEARLSEIAGYAKIIESDTVPLLEL